MSSSSAAVRLLATVPDPTELTLVRPADKLLARATAAGDAVGVWPSGALAIGVAVGVAKRGATADFGSWSGVVSDTLLFLSSLRKRPPVDPMKRFPRARIRSANNDVFGFNRLIRTSLYVS